MQANNIKTSPLLATPLKEAAIILQLTRIKDPHNNLIIHPITGTQFQSRPAIDGR